jgi:archaemetzincin
MESVSEAGSVEAIHLLTVGPFPRLLAEDLTARLSREVGVPCRLLEEAGEIEPLILPERAQVHADDLLRQLETLPIEDGTKLVAVTLLDIAIPIFTFVFGRSRLGGPATLVSLARLKPEFYGMPADPTVTVRRGVAEILHEVGHSLELKHCRNYSCLMYFSHDVETVDLRGLSFCTSCAPLLPAGFLAPGRPRF